MLSERLSTSDTIEPDIEPVSVPPEVVVFHVPVNDEPACEMVSWMTQEAIRAGAHVVPPQRPATFAGDGAVGVESQPVASVTASATAARPRRYIVAAR